MFTAITKLYAGFERLVAFLLSLAIIGVIVITGAHLAVSIYDAAIAGVDAFEYATFQAIFANVLTVLIALEFNHSLTQVITGAQSFIQVRTVVLIGILAVVRKVILIDINETDGLFLIGLGVAILTLGAVYVMLVYMDSRDDDDGPGPRRRLPFFRRGTAED